MPVPLRTSAAKPVHGSHFDPWNSISTGHQRPENTPGTGWRDSRSRKLNNQYQSSRTGGERLSDTWGAGSEHYDEKKKALIPPALRQRASNSVLEMLVKPGRMKDTLSQSTASSNKGMGVSQEEAPSWNQEKGRTRQKKLGAKSGRSSKANAHQERCSDVNARCTTQSYARYYREACKGRRGLAGGKFEKEIKKIGGCGIKFVGPEWVLESIKAGKRLPEARFTAMKIAPKAQGSVHNLFTEHQGPGF
uniref:BRCT domain-containing protein n=1 Tax=Bionectria ochroleuca TaxID=29856 RepID=A0A8H7NFJ2_BIOOC